MSAQPEWTPPTLRPQDELKAMSAYVSEHGYGDESKTYVRGIVTALNWVTGESDVSPITRTRLGRPVEGMDASGEHSRAYEALYPTSDPALWKVTQEQGQDYTLAVEHTLAWATGGDIGLVVPADWPWPQDR
ncbi:hypothetical protein [Streptomyces chartreusis]|uniref:Uncharacterized protein n=1 Tax=Streptomyces chartreusis TaxID=1969 RepID=A0A7H8TAT2_STRCX|nr:hypothetical protein [Streptomyces chartreusis]QKZ20589.1 hypothetical protein HUT05_26545 [Streptomyces chartreusis]